MRNIIGRKAKRTSVCNWSEGKQKKKRHTQRTCKVVFQCDTRIKSMAMTAWEFVVFIRSRATKWKKERQSNSCGNCHGKGINHFCFVPFTPSKWCNYWKIVLKQINCHLMWCEKCLVAVISPEVIKQRKTEESERAQKRSKWRMEKKVLRDRREREKNRTIVESEHRTFHYWININMRVFKSNCCITFYPLRWHFPLCHAHTTYFRLPCVIRGLESNSFPTTTFSYSSHTHTHTSCLLYSKFILFSL